jgi:hypothetical protein
LVETAPAHNLTAPQFHRRKARNTEDCIVDQVVHVRLGAPEDTCYLCDCEYLLIVAPNVVRILPDNDGALSWNGLGTLARRIQRRSGTIIDLIRLYRF